MLVMKVKMSPIKHIYICIYFHTYIDKHIFTHTMRACVHAKLYLTLYNPMDCGLPASSMGFPRQEH